MIGLPPPADRIAIGDRAGRDPQGGEGPGQGCGRAIEQPAGERAPVRVVELGAGGVGQASS
ncbi:MAG TPA: hypothetical protein VHT91_46035 [Kofleriaceae bacterium]|nr:hypothetical protein [Kofleriaceae bacterium]